MTRWGVVALAVVAMLTVLGGVAALVIGRLGGSAPPSPAHSSQYVMCAYVDADDGYCKRFAEDIGRRTELTQEQRDRLEADVRNAQSAVQLTSSCMDRPTRGVVNRAPGCEGRADDESIRLALAQAGYPGAVVRAARDNDPAPHDTIVFGVPIAEACFVGWTGGSRGGGGSYSLQGRLSGDRCLAD